MGKIEENKINEILNKTALSESSVKWWEKQVNKALLNLEKLDASLGEIDPNKRDRLIDQLMMILNRSEIELKIIYEIEKEIEDFIREQGQNKKSKNKRKQN